MFYVNIRVNRLGLVRALDLLLLLLFVAALTGRPGGSHWAVTVRVTAHGPPDT